MAQQKYFDMEGNEILAGMYIQHVDEDKAERVYASDDDDLGLNASNEDHVGFMEDYRELYPLYQFATTKEWRIVRTK